jgi:hypothetical protein
LTIKIQTNASITPEEVAKIVQRLIDIGLADAGATLEDGANCDEGDVEAAQLATDLNISAPVVTTTPRVLIIVSGGVADPTHDDGVDVEVFDWDNYNDLDEDDPDKQGVPAYFADLANPCNVPVEGE